MIASVQDGGGPLYKPTHVGSHFSKPDRNVSVKSQYNHPLANARSFF